MYVALFRFTTTLQLFSVCRHLPLNPGVTFSTNFSQQPLENSQKSRNIHVFLATGGCKPVPRLVWLRHSHLNQIDKPTHRLAVLKCLLKNKIEKKYLHKNVKKNKKKKKKRKAGQWFPLATGVHFEGHCSHESARTLRGCHLSLNSSHQFKIPHCIAMKRGGVNITLHLHVHVYGKISAVQVKYPTLLASFSASLLKPSGEVRTMWKSATEALT